MQKGRHEFQIFHRGQRINVRPFNSSHTYFTPTRKSIFSSLLTTSTTLMLHLYTRLLYLGLKVSTALSLPPVSLEQEEMTTLQIALPLLVGSPTKGLPLEVWPGRKSFLDGGLELVVRR